MPQGSRKGRDEAAEQTRIGLPAVSVSAMNVLTESFKNMNFFYVRK